MDLWTLLTIIFRRWYLSIPLVVLTVVSSLFAADKLGTEYRSTTVFQLVGPNVELVPEDPTAAPRIINPFVYQTAGTLNLARATAEVMNSQGIQDLMAEQGLAPALIEVGDLYAVVETSASSEDPELAFETVTAVSQRFAEEAENLQRAQLAPDDQLIKVQVLTPPSDPVPSGSSRLRFMALGTFLGLVATAIIVVAADYRFGRRRSKVADDWDDDSDEPNVWSKELEDELAETEPVRTNGGQRSREPSVARS